MTEVRTVIVRMSPNDCDETELLFMYLHEMESGNENRTNLLVYAPNGKIKINVVPKVYQTQIHRERHCDACWVRKCLYIESIFRRKNALSNTWCAKHKQQDERKAIISLIDAGEYQLGEVIRTNWGRPWAALHYINATNQRMHSYLSLYIKSHESCSLIKMLWTEWWVSVEFRYGGYSEVVVCLFAQYPVRR